MPTLAKIYRILVADDEEPIRRALKTILTARNYTVVLANNGEEAIEKAIQQPPDLVILDLSMPGMDGFRVCQGLRSWLGAPILILSVREAEKDKVNALDLGADDYLTKPFSASELLARVRALLRRANGSSSPEPVFHVDDLMIDIARRRVSKGEAEIKLTRTEFDILAYLLKNANRVVTSRMILQQVWGPEYTEDFHTLRVHIGNLRKKIEPDPSVPRYILTETSVGYQFCSN
jgi:two-component system KDP operon response regulator KdpE